MAIADLVVKQDKLEEAALESAIRGFFYYADAGKLAPTKEFTQLKERDKISRFILAKAGWKFVPGKEEFANGVTNKELVKLGINFSTVRVVVSELRNAGLIETQGRSHYPTNLLMSTLT